MILRYELQIQTMIKAMIDTVLPAVDPRNGLAQEQAQLIIGTLKLMAEQLPLQYRFDCDELTRQVSFAEELSAALDSCPGPVAETVSALTSSVARGRTLLTRPLVDPAEIITTAREIRTALDHAVDAVFTDDSARNQREDIQRIVLDQSRDEITRDRVWNRAQGFDTESQHLPTIESLLAPSAPMAVVK